MTPSSLGVQDREKGEDTGNRKPKAELLRTMICRRRKAMKKSGVLEEEIKKKKILPGGCSLMTLRSKEGNPYWFRTCDITFDLRREGAGKGIIKKGELIEFEKGKGFESRYEILGISYCSKTTWLLDGMNEAGLCGGLLMLPEGLGKSDNGKEADDGERWKEVMAMEAVAYFLASCKNIEEVISRAKIVEITNIPYGEEILPATVHYHFMDGSGKEVILEAADPGCPGRFRIYQGEEVLGIMTNSPTYDLQKENLVTFLQASVELRGLSGEEREGLTWDGKGISDNRGRKAEEENRFFPGSYTSRDRFLRLALLKALNYSGNHWSKEEILARGISLMNTVREPDNRGILHYRGIVAGEEGKIETVGREDSKTYYLVIYDVREKTCFLQWFDELEWTCYTLRNN